MPSIELTSIVIPVDVHGTTYSITAVLGDSTYDIEVWLPKRQAHMVARRLKQSHNFRHITLIEGDTSGAPDTYLVSAHAELTTPTQFSGHITELLSPTISIGKTTYWYDLGDSISFFAWVQDDEHREVIVGIPKMVPPTQPRARAAILRRFASRIRRSGVCEAVTVSQDGIRIRLCNQASGQFLLTMMHIAYMCPLVRSP